MILLVIKYNISTWVRAGVGSGLVPNYYPVINYYNKYIVCTWVIGL